jgi:multidrug efflux pump subunit AcrA (membrane-fusion protein)
VSLNLGVQKHIVIPDQAVVRQVGTNDRYVFVYDNGVVRKIKIELGQMLKGNYEILTKDVNDGDQVVVAGWSKLIDGSKVNVLK